MAYTKLNLTDGIKLKATHLSHYEGGIASNDARITALEESGGTPGEKGEDGYTPVRGVDYWTDEDKAEIKAYVDEAILGGAW